MAKKKKNGNGKNEKAEEESKDKKTKTQTKESIPQPLRKLRNYFKSKEFEPKNASQRRFLESIEKNDIVFNIGSAGTGKTFVAVSYAIQMLASRKHSYKKIVLVRPAVTAGHEKIGFLPGEKEDKMGPFMQPVYDVLGEYNLARKDIDSLLDDDFIEICPLAFMRGRSLNQCIVIIEESQNLTTELMEMLLTRIGKDSKFIFTGDLTQRDLDKGCVSGIEEAMALFAGVGKIDFIFFQPVETLRNALVEVVVSKYAELRESKKNQENENRNNNK